MLVQYMINIIYDCLLALYHEEELCFFGNVLTNKVLGQEGNDRQALMTITKLTHSTLCSCCTNVSDCICISLLADQT